MSDTVPPVLEELQIWFSKNLTRPFRQTAEFNLPVYPEPLIEEIKKQIAPGPFLSPEQRFGIYNQQYWWRLFVLLQEIYPTLVRLFGYRDFNTLIAEPYLLRHPPTDWFLPYLGNDLPKWIQEEYQEDDRELLFQMAEIDLAHEHLFHAGAHPIPTAESLMQKLYLQPFLSLFHHSADLFSFRSQLLEHGAAYWQAQDLPQLDNSKRTYYSLLYRTKGGLLHEELELAQYQLLSAFQRGAHLSEACSLVDPNCASAIGSWFKTWMERGFFTLCSEARTFL
jgi:hypothetical protein